MTQKVCYDDIVSHYSNVINIIKRLWLILGDIN